MRKRTSLFFQQQLRLKWKIPLSLGVLRRFEIQNMTLLYQMEKASRRSMSEKEEEPTQEVPHFPLGKYSEVYHCFMMINKKSGNLAGKELINSSPEHLSFQHDNNLTCFHLFDLYIEAERSGGLRKASSFAEQGANVRIIICGGDGTIEWILQEASKLKVNFDKIVFGVLPIGTGNDFAKSVGWDRLEFSGYMSELRSLALSFSNCTVSSYDIWQCEIQCEPTGKIKQIKNGKQVTIEGNKLSRSFTNYFGLGTDARICYISQKLNPKGVFMKKMVYGLSGFLSFFLQWGSLTNKIRIKEKRHSLNNTVEAKIDLKTIQDLEQTIEELSLDEEEYQEVKIGRFDQCITFINSTSSMELKGIWDTPHQVANEANEYKEQKVDDEMIEMVSYTNEISLLLERACHMAKRVSQSKGPYVIQFKSPDPKESNYIHINGEPYRVDGLQSVVIRPSNQIPKSKIKVLSFNK